MVASIVGSVAITAGNENSTNHTIDLPDGITVGETVLVWAAARGGFSQFVSVPSGWTERLRSPGSGLGQEFPHSVLFYKVIDGTEGFNGTGDTISVTTPGNRNLFAIASRIQNAHASNPIKAAEIVDGNAAAANPPSVDALVSDNYLFISGFSVDSNVMTVGSVGVPAGYTSIGQGETTAATNVVGGGTAQKTATAQVEDPASFTGFDVGLVDFQAFTVAIAPAVVPPPEGTFEKVQDHVDGMVANGSNFTFSFADSDPIEDNRVLLWLSARANSSPSITIDLPTGLSWISGFPQQQGSSVAGWAVGVSDGSNSFLFQLSVSGKMSVHGYEYSGVSPSIASALNKASNAGPAGTTGLTFVDGQSGIVGVMQSGAGDITSWSSPYVEDLAFDTTSSGGTRLASSTATDELTGSGTTDPEASLASSGDWIIGLILLSGVGELSGAVEDFAPAGTVVDVPGNFDNVSGIVYIFGSDAVAGTGLISPAATAPPPPDTGGGPVGEGPLPGIEVDWIISVSKRVPSTIGPPLIVEIGELQPIGSISFMDEINFDGEASFSIDPELISEDVAPLIRELDDNPLEVVIRREGQFAWQGTMLSAQLQGPTLTINARGLGYYLRYMTLEETLEFIDVDLFDVVRALVNSYQSLEGGNYGIITSESHVLGQTITRTYDYKEEHNLFERIVELADIGGFEFWIDENRVLRLADRKGSDKQLTVYADFQNIIDANMFWSVSVENFGTVALAVGSTDGEPSVTSIAESASKLSTFGRVTKFVSAEGVTQQATIDAHASRYLSTIEEQVLLPGPSVASTEDVNPSTFEVGDKIDFVFKVGKLGTFQQQRRVIARRSQLDEMSRETMEITFE